MGNKILVADDDDLYRGIMVDALKNIGQVIEATDGRKALQTLLTQTDDIFLLVLDLKMPIMDGFVVMEGLKQKNLMERMHVVVVTEDTTSATEKRCLELGVYEFIRKPFDNDVFRKRVERVFQSGIRLRKVEEQLKQQQMNTQRQMGQTKQMVDQLNRTYEIFGDMLGSLIESRNSTSRTHIRRVKKFTQILAEQLKEDCPEYKLTKELIDAIVWVSAFHDIGKIGIPDAILLKPARLTGEESEIMNSHTTKGSEIIKDFSELLEVAQAHSKVDIMKLAYDVVRFHHERYDGSGYPDHLSGDNIPIAAQIVSVADAYDELISERIYKSAVPPEEAFQRIITGEQGMFSPKLLEALRKKRNEMAKVIQEEPMSEF